MPRVVIGGDAMLGRLVDRSLATRAPDAPWRGILPVVDGADVFLYNLECAVCGEIPEWEPFEKTFHFRLDAGRAATLTASRVDAVQIANNHVMDHGGEGMLQTRRVLQTLGIPCAGAGGDLREAQEPALVADDLALVAATDHPREWAAEADRPGVFLVDPGARSAITAVGDSIALARERGARTIVVGLHWGPNMRRTPPLAFRRFARALVGRGATIVWGTSAHLFQGIEWHRDGLILYDTGDLVDDYKVDHVERNDISFLFDAEVEDGRVLDLALHPILIERCATGPAPEREARWARERLAGLCRPMGTELVERDGELHAVAGALAR